MKKKKKKQNNNGIVINDSITMSVKKKKINLRKPEAVFVAVVGYFSVIFAFLGMFDFNYDKGTVFFGAIILSTVYIIIALIGKFIPFIGFGSVGILGYLIFRNIDTAADGYKFVYNTIYHKSYLTEIDYYKFLDYDLEVKSVTLFFLACLWLLAIIIYFFTIYHPNNILPMLSTFPIIETGLYNGIEMPVIWGTLTAGYWIAILAMTTMDSGQYSGGTGGFVRKENRFFPKRQMRLKVTEKCGVYIILTVAVITLISTSLMKSFDYHRSESIKKVRTDVRDAVSTFSFDNLAESISNLTGAFGLEIKYQNHRLGNNDRLRYRDEVDLVVGFDNKYEKAVYLKDYTGSLYEKNQWFDLPEEKYSDSIFGYFNETGIFPQNFPYFFNVLNNQPVYTMIIDSKIKSGRSFAPYGISVSDDMTFTNDCTASTRKTGENRYSYVFSPVNADELAENLSLPYRSVYSLSNFSDSAFEETAEDFCKEYHLVSYDNFFPVNSPFSMDSESSLSQTTILMTGLMEEQYRQFVYDNYLEVPDNSNMSEVRSEYISIMKDAVYAKQPSDKLDILKKIRQKMSEDTVYSLDPGRTPANRDFVNYFLIENKKGYCTHFATAGVILARMAGIPARYATGYIIVGNDFSKENMNSEGNYVINVKDNRSHAWAEIYLDGYGWVPFEFTSGYTERSIDTSPATETTTVQTETTTTDVSGSKDTREKNSRTTGSRTSSQTKTTTSAQTQAVPAESTQQDGYAFPGFGHTGGKPLPQFVKNIIFTILMIGSAVLFVFVRRIFILWLRKRRFTTGSHSRIMAYMYRYGERITANSGIQKNNMFDIEYSDAVESVLGGRYFKEGEFRKFVLTALNAEFGASSPDKNQLKESRKFIEGFAEDLYSKSGILKKIYIKYVLVLI